MKIHAIVGRARMIGYALAVTAAGSGIAARRNPDQTSLKLIALGLGICAATLLLAAITHRALFRRIDEASETPAD